MNYPYFYQEGDQFFGIMDKNFAFCILNLGHGKGRGFDFRVYISRPVVKKLEWPMGRRKSMNPGDFYALVMDKFARELKKVMEKHTQVDPMFQISFNAGLHIESEKKRLNGKLKVVK